MHPEFSLKEGVKRPPPQAPKTVSSKTPNQIGWTDNGSYVCECEDGYESFSPNQGCRDINECCNKENAICSETCVKTVDNDGICVNRPGTYSCETCSMTGKLSFDQ